MRFCVGVVELRLDAGELLTPTALRGCAGLVEVPVGLLGAEISCSAFRTDGGDAGAYIDHFAGMGFEMKDCFEVVPPEARHSR